MSDIELKPTHARTFDGLALQEIATKTLGGEEHKVAVERDGTMYLIPSRELTPSALR